MHAERNKPGRKHTSPVMHVSEILQFSSADGLSLLWGSIWKSLELFSVDMGGDRLLLAGVEAREAVAHPPYKESTRD